MTDELYSPLAWHRALAVSPLNVVSVSFYEPLYAPGATLDQLTAGLNGKLYLCMSVGGSCSDRLRVFVLRDGADRVVADVSPSLRTVCSFVDDIVQAIKVDRA